MKCVSSWLQGRTGTPASISSPSGRTGADSTTRTCDSAGAPTPSSSHSLDSPSPSPQPQTPVDRYFPDRRDYLHSGAATSKPISIKSPRTPVVTGDPADDLVTQFAARGDDFDADHNDPLLFDDDDDDDYIMTTGPSLESAFGRSRKDSFVSAGPKPISMNPNREGRARRESLAGSLLNGMSWGGASVGSFMKDDLLMTGTSPFTGAQGASSSFQSNSYIPKMEANYLRNFVCCDQKLENMHDLLRHYETVHTQDGARGNRAGVQMGQRLSISRPSVTSIQQNAQDFQSPGQFGLGQQSRNQRTNSNGLGFGNMQMGRQQSSMDNSTQIDLDGLGDMELDDAVATMELDDSQRTIQQTRQMFGQQQRPQLQLNLNGTALSQQALRASSQPSTPGGAGGFGFQNNPTVSSVNTPTLTTQQVHNGQIGAGANGFDDVLSGMGNTGNMNLDFGMFGNGDLSGFVNDPAKSLFSPNGTSGQDQRALQQQIAQFGLDPAQFGDLTDPHQLALLQRVLGGGSGGFIVPREEDKPFKCPVIGCEKAYKNQNGLKYHKQHGHQTQQLHENGDGTFSIVNPDTNSIYPGEMGMEKEKPHKCEYCGKRYKNLNGLKYHKSHSPACEIAAQAAQFKATLAANSGNQLGMNLNLTGLPGIGEEMQM